MIDLTILFILLNLLLATWLSFANGFQARKHATALLPPVMLLWFVDVFDVLINTSRIRKFFVDWIITINVFTASSENQFRFASFVLGLVVILEVVGLYLMLYALYANLFLYTPPVLRSTREKQTIFWTGIMWKIILFVACNLLLIFILRVFNHLMMLEPGFLERLFSLGAEL